MYNKKLILKLLNLITNYIDKHKIMSTLNKATGAWRKNTSALEKFNKVILHSHGFSNTISPSYPKSLAIASMCFALAE